MNRTKNILWGMIFVICSQILSLGLGYFVRFYLARNLSLSDFGLFYAVFGFVGAFLIFRDMGVGTAMGKIVPELFYKNKKNQAHTIVVTTLIIQLIFSGIISLILFSMRNWLAQNFFREETAAILINIFIFYIFLSAITLWAKHLFRAYKKNLPFSMVEPIRNAVNLILLIIIFKFLDNSLAPTLAISLSWLVTLLLFLPAIFNTHNFFHKKIERIKSSIKNIFSIGIPVMFNDFAESMITRIDIIVLTWFTTLSAVGIYSAVYPLSLIILIFGKSLATIIIPHASELKSMGKSNVIENLLRTAYKYSFLISIPMVMVALVFSKEIINILYGSDFVTGYVVFNILAVGALFNMLTIVNNHFLVGIGKPKEVSKIITYALIFNIIGNIILIPILGLVGAAITSAISYAIALILTTKSLKGEVKTKIPYMAWLKTVILTVIVVLVTVQLNRFLSLDLIIKIPILLVILLGLYVLGVIILRLASQKEIIKLKSILFSKEKIIKDRS